MVSEKFSKTHVVPRQTVAFEISISADSFMVLALSTKTALNTDRPPRGNGPLD
jgi:hypothetical protein